MKIAIIGLPGSGKTTVASVMATMFDCMIFNITFMLRKDQDTHGHVDYQTMSDTINNVCIGNKSAAILDGYPNSIWQYEALTHELNAVVYIKFLTNTELIERLHRRDGLHDSPHVHREVAMFYKYTVPLIQYLERIDKLVVVYGEFNASQVYGRTILALSEKSVLIDNYIHEILLQRKRLNRLAEDYQRVLEEVMRIPTDEQ